MNEEIAGAREKDKDKDHVKNASYVFVVQDGKVKKTPWNWACPTTPTRK
jgi:hypothetical protein